MNVFYLIALIAGALTPLAFSPINAYFLAILTPAVLLILWLRATPKQAFWQGFCYGIGVFGVGVSWIYISIHTYGNSPALLAAFFTALFVMTLSLFPAIQGYCFVRFFPQQKQSQLLLAFPATWMLSEWLRGLVLSGFPWLLLAHSQIQSPLRGYIPLVGELGTTFVIVLSSGLIIAFIKFRKYRYLLVFISLWWAGSLLATVHWTQATGSPIKVTLVQGNIPQELKWEPDYLENTLDTYTQLTTPHWGEPIIVWPEAAIPLPLPQAKGFVDQLNDTAKHKHTTLLTGIPIQTDRGYSYYNSIIALGNAHGRYDKRHLVPFGEYVPLERWLRGVVAFFDLPMSVTTNGIAHPIPLIAASIPIAPFVCYEIAYENLIRTFFPQAQLLLTVSNDAWFGDSWASWQHLQINQFRAIQTGRDALFSANSGLSAVIDDRGVIQTIAPQQQEAVVSGTVQPRIGSTPWVMTGSWPILLLGFLICLFV